LRDVENALVDYAEEQNGRMALVAAVQAAQSAAATAQSIFRRLIRLSGGAGYPTLAVISCKINLSQSGARNHL